MPDPVHTPYVFDLDGGRACLDFANSRSFSVDHLNSYADLLDFAAQANLVTPETADWLHVQAARAPAAAEAVFEHARALRDALRRMFLALANGERADAADLDALNANLATSLAHARVLREPNTAPDAYVWGWAGADLDSPVWPIVRSAADVLTSEQERLLVRECGASDCMWLFMDSTKNRSRQWCSMTSCGNREKARRHYQRVKANRTADAGGQTRAADAPRARWAGAHERSPSGRCAAQGPAAWPAAAHATRPPRFREPLHRQLDQFR